MTRPIDSELAARLATGVTTLSTVYIVTRGDGVVLGFTDHDRPLLVEGVECRPETGFDPSTLDETLGATTDGSDVLGVLDDERITRADIELGLWDRARVQQYLVDWRRPDLVLEISRQEIAEIRISGVQLVAQLRSGLASLNEERGRLLEHDCPFQFGDADCGFDRESLEVEGLVSGVGSDFITADIAALEEDGFYDLGRVRFSNGSEAHIANHTGVRLTFFDPLAVLPELEAEILLSPGCDRSWGACRRYGNTDNYGGFPFMLGSDAVVQSGAYPGQVGGVSQFLDGPPPQPENVRLLTLDGNSATIGFDPAPVYVRADAPVTSEPVYGLTGQVVVGNLPYDSEVAVQVVSVVGDEVSDPVEVIVITGPEPPPEDNGGDQGDQGDGGDQGGDGGAGDGPF